MVRCNRCGAEPKRLMCGACVDELVDLCCRRTRRVQSAIVEAQRVLTILAALLTEPATDSHAEDDG